MFTKFGDKEKIKDSYLVQTSIIIKSSTQVHVTLVARYNAISARVIVTKFGSYERYDTPIKLRLIWRLLMMAPL